MSRSTFPITPADIAKWPAPERTWLPGYAGTLFAVGTLLVSLRIWLRVSRQAGALGLDDALMFGAWAGGLMYTVTTILLALNAHIGRHIWDVPPKDYEKTALLSWVSQFAFLVTGACLKISVLLFYRRLVKDTVDWWKWAVLAAVTFTATYTVALLLALVLNCNPTEAYWKSFDLSYTRQYHCVDTTSVNVLSGTLAIVSDLYAVVLPCLMTRHFKLAIRQRIALNSIFALGLVVVGASIARTYYLYEVGHNSNVSTMIYNATACSQAELQLGIICASLPALRVFVRKYLAGRSGHTVVTVNRPPKQGPTQEGSDGVQNPSGKLPVSIEQIFERADATAAEDHDPASPTSVSDSTRTLMRSPMDYEMHGLQALNSGRSRYSILGRSHAASVGEVAAYRPTQPLPRLPP